MRVTGIIGSTLFALLWSLLFLTGSINTQFVPVSLGEFQIETASGFNLKVGPKHDDSMSLLGQQKLQLFGPPAAITSQREAPSIFPTLTPQDQTQTFIGAVAENPEQVEQSQYVHEPTFEPGEYIKLFPIDSVGVIPYPNGLIQFTAELGNPHKNQFWQVQVEAVVRNNDGSTRTTISPRVVWMMPGQTLKLPIKFRAKESKYQPGFTEFKALVRDMDGKIIDRATISFVLSED